MPHDPRSRLAVIGSDGLLTLLLSNAVLVASHLPAALEASPVPVPLRHSSAAGLSAIIPPSPRPHVVMP